MPRYHSANDIINSAAVEVGLGKVVDPVGSTDDKFQQLRGLLDSAGQELVELYEWQTLVNRIDFTTNAADSGLYDLPPDYAYMINQTGWDRTNSVPLGGPLSAQDYTYLEGRDLVGSTIYANFRIIDDKLLLYPQPPPDGLNVNFEYISRNWVANQTLPDQRYDIIQTGSDIILYDPVLIRKFLKVKWLDSKGLPSQAAWNEYDRIFLAKTGHDKGARILSTNGPRRGYPYLDARYSTPDTNYGG